MKYKMGIKDAAMKCQKMPTMESEMPTLSPPTTNVPRYQVVQPHMPVMHYPSNFGYQPVYPQQYHYRGKRDLESLHSDVMAKLGNMTCMLREMGFINEKKQIDVEGVKKMFKSLPGIDFMLKEDMVKSVDTCAKMAQCMPVEEYAGVPVGKDLVPAMMFVHCCKGKKIEACVKKDLREKLVQHVQNGMVPDGVDEMFGREGVKLPESGEEMEAFMFAMMFDQESNDMFQ